MARDPVQAVIAFNQRFRRRYPALLRAKIKRMADSPFGFFRGSFHLFARTAFALAYSELVEDDHRRFCARRAEVEAALT